MIGIRPFVFGVLVVGAASLACGSSAAQDKPATKSPRDLWKEFIERQYDMTPVTGEFVVTGKSNRTEEENKPREVNGRVAVPHPAEWVMKCRWSFDRTRELLDCHDGTTTESKNRFLIDGGSSISGNATQSYNLQQSNFIQYARPGSFYFLSSSRRRWQTIPEDPEFKLAARESGSQVILSASNERYQVALELILDRKSMQLSRASGTLKGKPVYELEISSFSESADGLKRFPKVAKITIWWPDTGRIMRVEELKTTSVTFPEARGDVDAAFQLELPKRAVIADRELNRAIVLDKPATAIEAIRNPSQFKSQPFVSPTEAVTLTPASIESNWLKWYWLAAAAFAVITVVAVLLRRRSSVGAAG